MDIIAEVKDFLYDENLKEQFESLNNEDSLLESGIIDSVRMLELISFLEKHYAIKVDDDDLYPENFDTFLAIENYIKGKLNEKSD